MTKPEILDGLKQNLAFLENMDREVNNQRGWSRAEKLVTAIALKFEIEALRRAIVLLSE